MNNIAHILFFCLISAAVELLQNIISQLCSLAVIMKNISLNATTVQSKPILELSKKNSFTRL